MKNWKGVLAILLMFVLSLGFSLSAFAAETDALQLKSKSARSDAEKVVLFLSDGKPTFYYDKNGETAGSGDEDADEDWWGNKYNWGSCSSAAYAQADKMTGIHYFYTIGIGRDENAINPDTLKELSVRIGE
ncbi:MAG: hypothetical protein KHZ86_06010, partial [Firmicutes bacterium]|nr:hypothetical protein [Bacillota bacterium]